MRPLPGTAACLFPLLADFEPKGDVARKYRLPCQRGTASQGTIAWSYCSPIAVNPGADGILDALENLSDQATAQWQPS
jgi:hypothetical protein